MLCNLSSNALSVVDFEVSSHLVFIGAIGKGRGIDFLSRKGKKSHIQQKEITYSTVRKSKRKL